MEAIRKKCVLKSERTKKGIKEINSMDHKYYIVSSLNGKPLKKYFDVLEEVEQEKGEKEANQILFLLNAQKQGLISVVLNAKEILESEVLQKELCPVILSFNGYESLSVFQFEDATVLGESGVSWDRFR